MRIIFVLLTLIFVTCGWTQKKEELDCSPYKTGKFVMTAPEGDVIRIKRTKKYQIEKYNRGGKKHKFKIEWVSDCEYILILKKTTSSAKAYEGKGLFCKIVSGDVDYYSCIVITPEHPSGRKCEITKLR